MNDTRGELKAHLNPLTPVTAQNPRSIRDMFGLISAKYDLANSILSFGIHHWWKKKLIRQAKVQPHDTVLDCATGTGDLAFLFEQKLRSSGRVTGCDFCEPMLRVAREKAGRGNSKIQFDLADVLKLPYATGSFDIVSISFGIRNVKDTRLGLAELGRVLKPSGRLLVLEFGQPRNFLMKNLYYFYSQFILPRIGGWVSGQPQAYQYLQESSAQFPCGDEFIEIAQSTGFFHKSSYVPLQSGIAYLYRLERNDSSSLAPPKVI